MREKLKGLNTTKTWLWGAIVVSFLMNIMFVGKSYMIYLSTDEQVPFAMAAYLNGVDWSSTTKNLAYYSYGYALILAPIFWITNSARALYQGAIVVNAVMASAIVPLAWSIGKRLNPRISDKLMVGIAFCVAHYSCVLVRSHLALYEMTLIFLVWLLTWLYFTMEEKPRLWKYLLFGAMLVYSYMVHQRMLGVVLAGSIVLLMHFVRSLADKKDKKMLLCFAMAVGMIMVVFLSHRYIKGMFKTALWPVDSNELVNGVAGSAGDTNDFAGLAGRFDKFLSKRGVYALIKAFFGQMYYMGVSTFLVGFVGAFYLLRTNLRTILAIFSGKQKREWPEYAMSHLFVLLMFGASLAISILFNAYIDGNYRADYLVYGRYIEVTFGPLLLIGLTRLVSKTENPAMFGICSVLALIICAFITNYSLGNMRYIDFSKISCIGISIFRYDGELHIYEGMVWAIGAFVAAFVLLRKQRERIQLITLVLIASGWTYIGARLLLDVILPAEKCTYEYSWLLDARDEGTEDWPIYYTGPSGKTYEASFIQYLMKDQVLQYIDISKMGSLSGDYYVINMHSPIEMQYGYTLKGCSNGVFIYKHDGSERDDVIELPMHMFQTVVGEHTEKGLTNNEPGILMYGPYLTLIAGTYEVEIQYEILSDEATGYFDMASGEVTHAANYFSENTCDEHGIYTARMQTCMIETWVRTEIRCFVESGQIRVLGARISWVDDMIDLPLSIFMTDNGVEDENGVVNIAPGKLFDGPNGIWYKGDYEIQIEYEAISDDLNGAFSFHTVWGQLLEQPIVPGDEMAVLKVSVGDEPMRDVNLRCEITSGQIRITNVTILREMEE